MSTCVSHKNGVKSRKRKRCTLCGEMINVGDIKDIRTGIESGEGFWTMHMHPECHAHEQRPGTVDPDWYYDSDGYPAFDRADVITSHNPSPPTP